MSDLILPKPRGRLRESGDAATATRLREMAAQTQQSIARALPAVDASRGRSAKWTIFCGSPSASG
jgi:hypothetical protein